MRRTRRTSMVTKKWKPMIRPESQQRTIQCFYSHRQKIDCRSCRLGCQFDGIHARHRQTSAQTTQNSLAFCATAPKFRLGESQVLCHSPSHTQDYSRQFVCPIVCSVSCGSSQNLFRRHTFQSFPHGESKRLFAAILARISKQKPRTALSVCWGVQCCFRPTTAVGGRSTFWIVHWLEGWRWWCRLF